MSEWIISSSALICVMMLLRGIIRGRISPRVQYAMWAIVLFRLLMPFSLFQSQLSVQNLHREIQQQPTIQQIHQTMSAPIVFPASPPPVSQPPATDIVTGPVTTPGASLPAANQEHHQNLSPGAEPQQTPTPHQTPRSIAPADLAIPIWLLGIGVMALWMAGCNLVFSLRLRRTRIPLEVPDSLLEVYRTDAVEVPCLYGLFRPAIYLTSETAENETLRRYVLTHELVHYRQFDHLWSVLRTVVLVIHWYNPLVWIAFRASREDGEMACDAGTLKELGEEHRSDYGRTIISLATRTRFRGTLITATSMTGGKRAIKERIVILMKNPKTAMMTMISLILCCGLIIGCTFTGAVDKPTEPEETTPVETTETTEPAETTVPITADPEAERINYYKELLTQNSWLNMAMNCLFDSPEEINMEYFFRGGIETVYYDPQGSVYPPQNVLDFLYEHNMNSPAIMPLEKLGNILKNIFGITVEEVTSGIPESWIYFGEMDSYYGPEINLNRMSDFVITSVIEQDQNIVQVYYTPIDNNFYLNNQQMLLTLYQVKEDTYRALSNQLLTADGQDYTIVTPEQIAQINVAFEDTRIWQDGDLTRGAPTAINGFFRCYYTCPEEIDLREFLRHFSGYGIVDGWDEYPTVTESEFRDLTQLENWPWESVTELNRMPVPIHKYRSQDIDAVLRHYAGIGLDQLNTIKEDSGAVYSSKYDSYYNFTSDYGPGYFNCIGGKIYDDHVELYDDQNHVLTLVERDGKYCIYSYTTRLWEVPIELTAEEIATVNERFISSKTRKVGSQTIVEPMAINCFFTCYYEDPTQIDLKEFLRHFSVKGHVNNRLPEITEEEFDEIKVLDGFPFPDAENLEDLPVPIHRYPAYLVDSVLERYAGITLKALTDINAHGDAFYSEKYDAYYSWPSDFNPGTFNCIGGYKQGSIVVLYSEDSVLTLQWGEYGYHIYSHLPRA